MKIKGLEWDAANRRKCQKHGIDLADIEAFFRIRQLYVAPDIKHSETESRYIAIGMLRHRPVFVAFTLRQGYIRPISARYMHPKEVKKYEKEIAPPKNE